MSSFRLSQAIVPAEYDIHLTPDIPAKVFTGRETIIFKKNAESSFAELFAEKMTIKAITQSGKPLEFTHEGDRLVIKGDNLAGAPVDIEFEGSLDHAAVGWYYVSDECASTQFEATHARKAIPCFDEPSVKSLFRISVTTLSDYIVLSNMPAEMTVTSGKTQTVSFFKTPPMCSYLLALVIGHFDRRSGFTKRGLPIDVYAPYGQSDYLQFPLVESIKAVEWYEEFTKVLFPLPRLQLIAVPNFPMGAMENFGLLIHRDTALLAKEGVTSLDGLKRAALVIAHEIAHQWCGDGVSPLWWNYLWLNEGFASIFPFVQFEETHPEWNCWADFEMQDVNPAMTFDCTSGTHPIDVKVETPWEIEGIFDKISYSKAACVIRMLMHYVGKEKFRDVLRVYFSRFMFKNAGTDDLCQIFTEVLKQDMKPFFDSWTGQSGFPCVILEEDLTIRQMRYTTSGLEDDRTWLIPLEITYCKNGKIENMKLTFSEKSTKFPIEGCEWIKLNTGNHVFARTWHKGKWLDALGKAISEGKLDVVDRYTVLNDARAMAQASIQPLASLGKLVRCYGNESVFLIVKEIADIFQWLYKVLANDRQVIKREALKVFHSVLERVGKESVPDETHDTKRVRAQVLRFLCTMEDPVAISILESLFAKYKETKEIEGPLIIPVFTAGVRTEGGVEFLKNLIEHETNPEIRQNAVRALGSARTSKLGELTEDAFTHGTVQDLSPFFSGVGEFPENGAFMWKYMKDNFDTLIARFGTTAFLLPSMLGFATMFFATCEEADDVEQFAKEHQGTILDRLFTTIHQSIRASAALGAGDAGATAAVLSQ